MSLDQIGQKLKNARDISGLSLAQIQEKTKIPYNHLASIDAGNFDDLPEPVYVSGFIRRYAECVGLDAQELVDEYKNDLEAASGTPKKSGILFKTKQNNGHNMPVQTSYYNRHKLEKSAPNLFKLVPFYALWIVLILVLIVYLVNRQGEIEQNQQDAALLTLNRSTSSITAPKPVQQPNTADTTHNQTAETESSEKQNSQPVDDGFKVSLRAKNHVWIEVKAISNGEDLFNGFLEPGEPHDFTDKEGLRISAGSAGNVLVTANGKTSELGAPGKRAEKIFSNNKVAETKNKDVDSDDSSHKATTASTHTTTASTTGTNKKPETTAKKPENAVSRKPTIANNLNKPKPIKESAPAHETNTPSVDASTNNTQTQTGNTKALDIPYRYSE